MPLTNAAHNRIIDHYDSPSTSNPFVQALTNSSFSPGKSINGIATLRTCLLIPTSANLPLTSTLNPLILAPA